MALIWRRALSLKEELMWDVVSDRVRVAERIEYTENKIGKLQQRVAPEVELQTRHVDGLRG